MRILVTGGAGYVGSHTVRRLCDAGHDVWVYDDLSTGHARAAPTGRLIHGSLAESAIGGAIGGISDALGRHSIEAVIHFAALCLVPESVREPRRYWENNVVGSLSLLEAMRQCDVRRIVFSSSCAVYGIPHNVPIREDEPNEPINPYGSTKLAVERLLADYARSFQFAAIALRYFNAAGASADGTLGEDHDPETHLIPLVLQTALGKRLSVEIFGDDYPTPDGTCVRDYVHVDDLAEAHILALEHIRPGQFRAYNVGTGSGRSVREVVEAARRVTGCPIPAEARPRRAGDPPALVAAADRIRHELGWQPLHSDLDHIIETAWRWHREHPEGYDD